ncbi:hypothetical protein GE061_007024 [Apolygus lucorum]|uniref:Uncharacterized protein n=1 Tax=Apolygus lucorum TaxID=248454 RepID=A0A8S9WSA7_APOLU|nr:hypothetical protein GE061_007024 [Apolygus lucorum]
MNCVALRLRRFEMIGNTFSKLDAQKAYKKYVSSMERSVQFWSEARGESRKITAARLKCAQHSEAAEALALTIWERMRPEQFRLVTEIDRLLTAHDEIRVAELRETLGQILEAVNVEIKELRAIHIAPIESLTLLLNHIIKIYNQRDVDSETSSDSFVPVSTRIEQMVAKAKELGLGNIEVPKNMYVSERAKLAMVEKQIIGKMKLKSLRSGSKIHDVRSNIKFRIDGARRRDETKKRLRKVVAIKERLRLEQSVKKSISKGSSKNISKRAIRKYSSFLKSDGDQTNSYHSLSSPQDTSFENVHFRKKERLKCKSKGDERGENASIDTSSWVISSTHKYYFGCSPPVIPKTSVTHEVYPKPVEDSKMTGLENPGDKDLRFFHDLREEEEEAHWLAPKTSFESRCSLNKVLGAVKEVMSDKDDVVREEMSTASSESNESLPMTTNNEEINCEESHGDASTIFAWTEPEKSRSFCLNSTENEMDVGAESTLMYVSSEAAGDGCDLARTKEESSILTLPEHREEEPEVQPPAAFSMTDVARDFDSNCSITSDTSSFGIHKKNLFSCNQFSETECVTECLAKEPTSASSGNREILDSEGEASKRGSNESDEQFSEDKSYPGRQTSPELAAQELTNYLESTTPSASISSRSQESPNFTVEETISLSLRPIKTEKITPAQKYLHPTSSASSSAGQTLSKSIIDELTVEILKRNSKENSEAKRESGNPKVVDEKDLEKTEEVRSGDFSKGDNIIRENSLSTPQSSLGRVDVRNEDTINEEKIDLTRSSSRDSVRLEKEPDLDPTNQPERGFDATVNQEPSDTPDHQPEEVSCSLKEVGHSQSVDNFSSAHDFGGTQLLYLRSTCPKMKSKSSKGASERLRPVNEPRPSGSTHSEYEPVTDMATEEACQLGGDTKKNGKRNDMVTLAVLAIALGLGTLGFMTSSGSGTGSIFAEMLGPAGGKALNVIEKALQVLRALNNRH